MTAPRRGRPPITDAAPTRGRIVEAATELFARKGFHGTGVAELGDAAGLQRGALYYHIGSKEELLWEILRDYVTVVLEAAEAVAARDEQPEVLLRSLIQSHVVLIVRFQREVAIQMRDWSALTGERAAELQELRDRVQRVWQRILDDGCRAGQFASADHVVTNSLLGMVNTVALWYRPDGPHTLDDIANMLADMVLRGLITSQ